MPENTIGQVLLVMFGFGYEEVEMDNIAKVFFIVGYGQRSSNVTWMPDTEKYTCDIFIEANKTHSGLYDWKRQLSLNVFCSYCVAMSPRGYPLLHKMGGRTSEEWRSDLCPTPASVGALLLT